MNKLKTIGGLLLTLCVLTCAIPQAWAQRKGKKARAQTPQPVSVDFSTLNAVQPLYLEAVSQGRDHTAPLTAVVTDYLKHTPEEKKVYADTVVARAYACFDKDAYSESLALCRLYDAFNVSPRDTGAAETMSYIRGASNAIMHNDTVTLKTEIAAIKALPASTDAGQRQTRLGILEEYLRQIREYIPAHNTLSGTWMSTITAAKTQIPAFVFDVFPPADCRTDTAVYELRKKHSLGNCFDFDGAFSDSSLGSQKLMTYAGDSIYCMWSSESLKNPSPELNMLFRSSGASLSNVFGQSLAIAGGGDFASNLAGGLMGDLMGMGVNALADAIFNPSKKAVMIQMKARKVNDRVLEGDIYFSGIKVKNGAVEKQESHVLHAILTKVEPEDSIYALGTLEVFPMNRGEKYKTKELRKIHGWAEKPSQYDDLQFFNIAEDVRQLYLTQRRLDAEGCKTQSEWLKSWVELYTPKIGVMLPYDTDGEAVVEEIVVNSPAYLAGMKKGDVITSIDGFDVTGWRDVYAMLRRCEPYKRIAIGVRRKDKPVELSVCPVMLYTDPSLDIEYTGKTISTVWKLKKNGRAKIAGLKKYDLITHIDGMEVDCEETIKKAMVRCQPFSDVQVTVIRLDKPVTFTVRPSHIL